MPQPSSCFSFSDFCHKEAFLKMGFERLHPQEEEKQIICGASFKTTPVAYRDIDTD